jgi:hypothetical protein
LGDWEAGMSEYKHLDDIERREHRDLRWQWLWGGVLAVLMIGLVVGLWVAT